MSDLSKKIYGIKNRAQLNAVILDAAISGDRFKRAVISVCMYVHSSGLESTLSMSLLDAKFAVETGVLVVNRGSKKRRDSTIKVSSSLRDALVSAIAINGGKYDLLFDSRLSSSNRAKVKIGHVSRQAVWKWVKLARDKVVSASRDAGISEYINLSPMSIINYKQGETVTIDAIEDLVRHHGCNLTEEALSELRLSIDLLKAK
jgi:hypothetical protein